MASGWIRAHAPATMANVGPGFDVFALALRGLGDEVAIRPAVEDSIEVRGVDAGLIPTSFSKNTAGIVIEAMRKRGRIDLPVEIRIRKGIPAARGLGSSAASCAAAALAFRRIVVQGRSQVGTFGPLAILEAAVEGEVAVSGRHYDNVAAALLGGLVTIASTEPLVIAREPVSERIHIALAIPDLVMRTSEMRKVLPEQVPLRDAVSNVGKAATLVLAFARGDAELAGRCLEDRFATDVRSRYLTGYEAARAAALEAGSTGFGISGSGSTVFSVAGSRRTAEQSAKAMQDAFEGLRVTAKGLTSQVDNSIPLRPALPGRGPRFSLVPQ